MNHRSQRVTIVGAGYVGLVTGVCFAAKGHHVSCVDLNSDLVKKLNKGEVHIHEKGLTELLNQCLKNKSFHATTSISNALAKSDVVIIAVGTPSKGGSIDLNAVRQSTVQIGNELKKREDHLSIIIKSTVIPGTTDTMVRDELEKISGKKLGEFGLGMNPEFLREGNAITDFMQADRIVLGYEDVKTLEQMRRLYASWSCEKLEVSTRTAEFIKYANNCLLATQISAVNELANLADELGQVDISEVIQGVTLDRRWSPLSSQGVRIKPGILSYLKPGCGFGGSCFPKDVAALSSQGKSVGLPMHLLKAVLNINNSQPSRITNMLRRRWKTLRKRQVLILGLAFKSDTDDVRQSASRKITEDLVKAGAGVFVHDPKALENFKKTSPGLKCTYVNDWVSAVEQVDAVIIATCWQEYLKITSPTVLRKLAGKVVFDPRRMFNQADFPNSHYLTIGFSLK
jgi:UDPglucose 6-dehydrogenase/GDP-mannose 6-dehydrogenase